MEQEDGNENCKLTAFKKSSSEEMEVKCVQQINKKNQQRHLRICWKAVWLIREIWIHSSSNLDSKMKGFLAFAIQKEFDKADVTKETIRVTDAEIEEAYAQIDPALLWSDP